MISTKICKLIHNLKKTSNHTFPSYLYSNFELNMASGFLNEELLFFLGGGEKSKPGYIFLVETYCIGNC